MLCFLFCRPWGIFGSTHRVSAAPSERRSPLDMGPSLEIEIMAKEDDLIDDPPSTRARQGPEDGDAGEIGDQGQAEREGA
jgi:hypothetical protein